MAARESGTTAVARCATGRRPSWDEVRLLGRHPFTADITTIAELGTTAGTLFLGVATFGATRSANRSARISERALLLGLRPVLTPARPEDPDQDIIFGDARTFRARSGYAVAEASTGSSTSRSRCGT